MGLFGKKKEIPALKPTDIFSEELLEKITTVIKPKSYGGGPMDVAKDALVEFARDPQKVYSYHELGNVIYSAGMFTRLEPDLAPLLKDGIQKYKAWKKQ